MEKLSYLPLEEVESAFEMLNRMMAALIDVDVVAEEHRPHWNGLWALLFSLDLKHSLSFLAFASYMRRTYTAEGSTYGKPHAATNLLRSLPTTTAMCENYNGRINKKIPRRHGLRSGVVEALRDIEADDHFLLLR